MQEVFDKALRISKPWFIDTLKFDVDKRRLDIYIDFEVGTKFEYIPEEEGLSSLIQSTKSKARGFNTFRNFKIVIYLITGDLGFSQINEHYKLLISGRRPIRHKKIRYLSRCS